MRPSRALFTPSCVAKFRASSTYREIIGFVKNLGAAAEGHPLSAPLPDPVSPHVSATLDMLARLKVLVDETPPVEQPMRFGNRAFKTWHASMVEVVTEYMPRIAPSVAPAELVPYLGESFGNPSRIDYGTGHETMFIMWCAAVAKAGGFVPSDMPALALKVFPLYISVARHLQTTYRLEPAGSHGVWSLDGVCVCVYVIVIVCVSL